MQQHAQAPSSLPRTPAPLAGRADTLAFLAGMEATMAELTALLAEETALVRSARVGAAAPLEARKGELSRLYMADLARLKAHAPLVRAHAGAAVEALKLRQQALHEAIELNVAVLATAHAVAEGIIRHVSSAVQARSAPAGYGANGRASAPPPRAAAPVAVVRSL